MDRRSLSLSEARAILIPLHLPQRSAANWQPRPAAAAFLANGEVLKCYGVNLVNLT